MKRVILCFYTLALVSQIIAQNPNQKVNINNNKVDYLTLSDGRYDEFHSYNKYERVGSAIIDMETNKIVRFIENDSVIDPGMYEMDMTTRFLTIDPLAEKYVEMNPYGYCANNPILFVDPDGMRIDVSQLYKKDDDGNYIYNELVTAFENFAKSDEGIEFLAKFAEEGQVIAGHTYDNSGEYHEGGVDLSYGAKELKNDDGSYSTANGETEKPTIVNGRGQISIFMNTGPNVKARQEYFSVMHSKSPSGDDVLNTYNKYIYSATRTWTHESFIHGNYYAGDYLDDKSFNLSNVRGTLSGNPHHYQARFDPNSLMRTKGHSLMFKMNQKYKQFNTAQGVVDDIWNFKY
ncbi:MAG: hypothetical protein JXB17_06600 [Bacteroidales bacterium]|nr:hypothetical protein [Bacteroidales bacterium]